MRGARAAGFLLGVGSSVALMVACGARSGLFLEDYTSPAPDDAQPGDDVVLPGIDAQPRPVVPLAVCADASDTLIYAVTEQNTLLKFNPTSAQFTQIGALSCPDPYERSPFSMAVDRQGNAYVLYFTPMSGETPVPGNIFKVDLNSAACAPTSYVPGQDGFLGFGMGFAADDEGGGETLYVASGDTAPGRLGAIDETTLALSVVGTFPPSVLGAELTGTGDGRLFAFYSPTFVNGGCPNPGASAIGQIDKTSGALIAQESLPQVNQGGGWAFAFWGGDFYIFTSPDCSSTIVQRYDPTDGSVVQIATFPEVIDGAGVSTCAPVQ